MALTPQDAFMLVDRTLFEKHNPDARADDDTDSVFNLIGVLPLDTDADPTIQYDEVTVRWKKDPVVLQLPEPHTPTSPQEMIGNAFLFKGICSDGRQFVIACEDQHLLKFNGTTYTVDEASSKLRAELDPMQLVAGIDETGASPGDPVVRINKDVNRPLYDVFEANLKAATDR